MMLLILFQIRVIADGENGQESSWSDPFQLSGPQTNCYIPAIAVNNSTVHVIYSQRNYTGIYYKRGYNNGTIWENEKLLINVTSGEPAIAVYNNNVHIVWSDFRNNEEMNISKGWEIYYKRSTDGGNTWSDDMRLSNADNNISGTPNIVCEGDIVHVVWGDARDSVGTMYYGYGGAIYYKKSVDNGNNWTNDTRISDTKVKAFVPSIAISGNYVYVAWNDKRDYVNDEIYFKRSIDQGETWENDTRLTFSENITSYIPDIAAMNESVYITWEEDNYYDGVSFIKSENYGQTWSNITPLTPGIHFVGVPKIGINENYIHIAFERGDSLGGDLFYLISKDFGENWENIRKITFNELVWSYVNIYVMGNLLHFVWTDPGEINSIFYMNNSNFGLGFVGIDVDGDWVENNNDAFPEDPAASIDSDGDGYPDEWNPWKTSEDSTTGLNLDVFPNNADEWNDTDNDSFGDNYDAFPTNPNEWKDTDNDSYGDNEDVFPNDPNEWIDSDGDGIGDNTDAYPNDPSKWEREESKEDNFLLILLIISIFIIIFIVLIYKVINGRRKS
ncbi:MAG: hypothetical protein JSW00_14510 [Thermoplasmata archaeon]|nr:MAG: hypothetical protein JSW00_14510 [Thermoplasmata archaeon]